jgi:hypothetical protein
MTNACPTWELAAAFKSKVHRSTGKFSSCIPVRDLHTAFNLPNVYDYKTKLCRQQAEVIQNHANEHVRGIGQENIRDLNFAVVKLKDLSSD